MGHKTCALKGRSRKGKRCPVCHSSQTLARMKTKDFWCRLCGTRFAIDKKGFYQIKP